MAEETNGSSLLDWNDFDDNVATAEPEQQVKQDDTKTQEKPVTNTNTATTSSTASGEFKGASGIEELTMGEGRITADQKSIINCPLDVNQLVPFKYHWAWNKYLSACANHWMPQEINMAADVALWKDPNGLTEDERTIIKRSLGFFSTADSLVANNLVLAVYRYITNPE